MTIDNPSATAPDDPLSPASRAKARSDFQALANDLQTGNLTNAQTDFASLLQDAPQLQTTLQTTAVTSPALSAFSSLSASLQAGDLTGAQSAMSTLQQSVQGHHHHHHHHHRADNDQDDALQSEAPTGVTAPATVDTAGASSSATAAVGL